MPLCPVCGANVPQGRLAAHVNACLDGRGPGALREELPPPLCMFAGEAALARLETRRKLHGSPCVSAPAGNVSGLLYVRLRSVLSSVAPGACDFLVSLSFEGQVYRTNVSTPKLGAAWPPTAEVVFSVAEYCASAPMVVQLHAVPASRGAKSPAWCCKSAVNVTGGTSNSTTFSREGDPLPPHALLLCESRVPLSSALHAAAVAAEAKLGLQHRRAIEAARTASRADELDADALLSAPSASGYASPTSPRRWWEDPSHSAGDSAHSGGSPPSRRSSGGSAGSTDSGAGDHDGAAGGGSARLDHDAGRGGGFGFRVSVGRSGTASRSSGGGAPSPSPAQAVGAVAVLPAAAAASATVSAASAPASAAAIRVPSSPSLDRGAAQRRLAVDPPGRRPVVSPLRRASAHDESSGSSGAASDAGAGGSSAPGDRDHLTLSEVLMALASENRSGALAADRPAAARSPRLAPSGSVRSLSPSIRIGPMTGSSSPGRAGWAAGETPSSAVERDRTLTAARALGWAPLPKHGSSAAETAAVRAAAVAGATPAAPAQAPLRLPFAFQFHGNGPGKSDSPIEPQAGANAMLGARAAVLHMAIPGSATLAALQADQKVSPDAAACSDGSTAHAVRGPLKLLAAAFSSLCGRGSRKQLSSKRIAASFSAGGGTAHVTLDLLYVAASDLAPSNPPASAATAAPAAAHASSVPAASAAADISDGVALAMPCTPACGLHRAAAAGAASLLAAGTRATDRLWLLARTPAVPPGLLLRSNAPLQQASRVPSLSVRDSSSLPFSVTGFQFGGLSVLDVAVLSGQRNIVGLLLERGSTLAAFSPRVSPGTHWGSLHYAALCPDERIAAVLLAAHCALMAAAGRSLPPAPALLNSLLREGCDDSTQAHKAHASLRGTGGWWRGIPFALQRGHFAARSHSETTRYVAGVRSLLVAWGKEDDDIAAALTSSAVAAARTAVSSTASQARAPRAGDAPTALASDDKEPDSESEGDGEAVAFDRQTPTAAAGATVGARPLSASAAAVDVDGVGSSGVLAAIQRIEAPAARAMATALLATARGVVHLQGGPGTAVAGGDGAADETPAARESSLTRHFAVHAPTQPHVIPSDNALAAGSAAMPLSVFCWRPASGRSAVVDMPDAGGNTALALACAAGHAKTVEMLLGLQACRGAANAAGDTPLMHSLRAYRPDIALQLLLWPDKPALTAGRSISIQFGCSGAGTVAATSGRTASTGRPLSMVAAVTVHAHAGDEAAARPGGALTSLMQRLQRRGAAAGVHVAVPAPQHDHHSVALPAAAVVSRRELPADSVATRVGPARPAATSSLAGETALLLAARALSWQRTAAGAGGSLVGGPASSVHAETAKQLQQHAQLLDVICLLAAAGASASVASKMLSPSARATSPIAAAAAGVTPVACGLPTARSLASLAAAATAVGAVDTAAMEPLASAASTAEEPHPEELHAAVLLEIEGETALHAAAKRGSVAGIRALCRLDDDALYAALHASSRRVSSVSASLAAAGLPSPQAAADIPAAVDTAVLVALGWQQHRTRSVSMSEPPQDAAASEELSRLPAVNVRVRDAAGRTPRECALIAASAGVDGAAEVAGLLEKLEVLQPATVRSGRRGSIVSPAGAAGGRRTSIGGGMSPAGRRLSGLDTSWLLAATGDAAASPLDLTEEARAGFAADAEDADATAAYLDTNALLEAGKSSVTPSAAAGNDQGDEE